MMNNYHVALTDLKVYALCTADRQDEWERGHDYQSEISHKLKVKQKAELLQELVDKATPMKVLNREQHSKDSDAYGDCPICKTPLCDYSNPKGCGGCLQAIDWSEK